MSGSVSVGGTTLGTPLQQLLGADAIEPGAEPSYQLCKVIYLYHPLGPKMTSGPIRLAQSQRRKITIPNSPEDRVREAFETQWLELGMDDHILNVATLARVYGIASLAVGSRDVPVEEPIDFAKIADQAIYFNVLDPLNTSGSLVLDQDPNSPSFQKTTTVSVEGRVYHRSRCCILMNEQPIYIAYTNSGFGYVGRSVYQRALFPLKSFIQTMQTDDMVSRKAGLLIAKMQTSGSIINNLMSVATGVKRNLLRDSETGNVLSISPDESVESLNLQNINGAGEFARNNILKNIATAADMPAKMLDQETMVEGFSEGTEDAKNTARYIDGVRNDLMPIYKFADRIVQHRAWNPEFYAAIQREFPEEYGSIDYQTAFVRWQNSFTAEWPSLLIEPESEVIKVEKDRLDAVSKAAEVLIANVDPPNRAKVIQWVADCFNANKTLFPEPLVLDYDSLAAYDPTAQAGAGTEDGGAENTGEGEEASGPRDPAQPAQRTDSEPRPPVRPRGASMAWVR